MTLFPFSKSKRPAATVAGIFGVALGSMLLLCGAGSAPIENLLPQGAMQGDFNAGGHSVTNAATVQSTNAYLNNLVVTNSFTPPGSFTAEFEPALGNPGTDGYVLSSTAAGVRSWIAAGGGSLSLGANASGAGFTFSSGTLDLSNAVNSASGLLQLDSTEAIPVSLVNTTSGNSGLNGLYLADANGNQLDLTGAPTGDNDSIGLYASDGSAIHIVDDSVLSVGSLGQPLQVVFGSYPDSFTAGTYGTWLIAPSVGGPTLYFAYNPMTTLGDLSYGGTVVNCYSQVGSSPVATPSRLAGNSSSLKKFLAQTGTGSASAAPVWSGLSLVSNSTPTTGATVSAATSGADETLEITPAGTLAALTISLPSAAHSQVGQIERGFISQVITSLTVNVSGSGTLIGPTPVTSAADSSFAYQCVSTSGSGTWIRLY